VAGHGETKSNGKHGWSTFYIPTHRGEAVMDGAPVRSGWLKEGQATARTKAALPLQDGNVNELDFHSGKRPL
jgi:hypothetical protein